MNEPKGTLVAFVLWSGPRGGSNQRADLGEPNEYSASNYPFDIEREVQVMAVRGCTQSEAVRIVEKARAANPGLRIKVHWTGDVVL